MGICWNNKAAKASGKNSHWWNIKSVSGNEWFLNLWKISNGEILVKAGLCAQGFEEGQHFQTDSPSCCKDSLRLTCCMKSSYKWPLSLFTCENCIFKRKANWTNYLGTPSKRNPQTS